MAAAATAASATSHHQPPPPPLPPRSICHVPFGIDFFLSHFQFCYGNGASSSTALPASRLLFAPGICVCIRDRFFLSFQVFFFRLDCAKSRFAASIRRCSSLTCSRSTCPSDRILSAKATIKPIRGSARIIRCLPVFLEVRIRFSVFMRVKQCVCVCACVCGCVCKHAKVMYIQTQLL